MALESEVQTILTRIQSQRDEMLRQLVLWAAINSGTSNLTGLHQLGGLVLDELRTISDDAQAISVPPQLVVDQHGDLKERVIGDVLLGVRRAGAPRQAVLSIHLDTVYPAESPFQKVKQDGDLLHGPGVADAKGGLVVLLWALKAYEEYVESTGNVNLGWKVILNSDEEIGSPASREVFSDHCQGADFGLLFEPCLPNGSLVGQRKGSGNFEIVVRGQAAHAGREFHKGRNAIVAAARVAQKLHALNGRWKETTINVAKIDGGGPTNVVPDTAVVRFNVRYPAVDIEDALNAALDHIVEETEEGITLIRHGGFFAPPKPMTKEYESLLKIVQANGKTLGLDLSWESTGGVCDGNRLAALGVPNIDTMGVRGGNIHSPQEYMHCDSLIQRTQLTFLTLITLAE
ncbi:Carboxypeptidase G2 precursor [Bremerella volcania]|uniref:Carboxypeptidase G2 n=1 Tax=Bremerella volcania TaxID=2527984 RepID=A0A518C8W2_9BACT|nr:hydrolase [Bremerella volcania]QDU75661.1 Carboxypeptidase G2 precursor [Bremerella volcania]